MSGDACGVRACRRADRYVARRVDNVHQRTGRARAVPTRHQPHDIASVLRYWARSSRTHPEDGSGHEGSRRTGTCIGERGTRSLTVSLLTVPQPGHPASFRPGATPLPLASPRPHVHRTARTPFLFYGPFLYRPSTNLPQVCTGLVLIFTKFSIL
jgi:hypothetical protein